MSINTRAAEDAKNVRTGKDGALFLNTDSESILISECNEFRITISFNNADWQPTSSSLVFGVPTGYTMTLTMNQTVVRDDLIMGDIIDTLDDSGPRADSRTFTFQTLLEGRNGKNERILITGCIPDGDVDLLNITPGEIVQRQWTFRCNARPSLLERLELDY